MSMPHEPNWLRSPCNLTSSDLTYSFSMNARFKTLLIAAAWVGFMLLWINHGSNPMDRVLRNTGAREQILQMCSSTEKCTSVRFERTSTFSTRCSLCIARFMFEARSMRSQMSSAFLTDPSTATSANFSRSSLIAALRNPKEQQHDAE